MMMMIIDISINDAINNCLLVYDYDQFSLAANTNVAPIHMHTHTLTHSHIQIIQNNSIRVEISG